jgi:hypothetical protein
VKSFASILYVNASSEQEFTFPPEFKVDWLTMTDLEDFNVIPGHGFTVPSSKALGGGNLQRNNNE